MRARFAHSPRQLLLVAVLLASDGVAVAAPAVPAPVAPATGPATTAAPTSVAPLATATAPAFDRPGIGFATTTLAPGTFAWEQGAPDFRRTSHGGPDTTLYSATTLLRAGLIDGIEFQAGSAVANRLQVRDAGGARTAHGRGDTTLALKAALPSPWPQLSWAALGAVTLTDGAQPFTGAKTAFDLGATLSYALSDAWSLGCYVNAGRADGATTVDFSPSLSFTITESLAGFVEAGANYGSAGLNEAVAGGGLTLMVTPAVQLDLSVDLGLTARSPKVQGGFGVSVYFK